MINAQELNRCTMHTFWRAKAGPPSPTRHTHIKTQGHTQIRQTLSLWEKMDLSAEEAMLRERKTERQGETESV